MAYVEEEPIAFSGPLKNNITLSKPMKKDEYNKAIKCCCLLDDFKNLEHGDETYINEKSANLSGGQKARIALARAVYSNKPIILLDNPLSGLDIRVAEQVNNNLRQLCTEDKRTIIMVLHSTYFLKSKDRILLLVNKNLREIQHSEV